MTVGGSEHTSHHTGDVTGEVIATGFGDGRRSLRDRTIQLVEYGSLLCGFATSRVLGSNARAGLSRGFGLANTLGGDRTLGWRRRGRGGTGIVVGSITRSRELRNSRSGEGIGIVVEGVDEDSGVIVRVSTGEFDKFIGAGGSGLVTTDRDLCACGVELGTSGLVGQMQGDDLVAKEIPTGGQVGGEGERVSFSVKLILLDPSRRALTNFGDLEPLSVGGVELGA